MNEKDPQVVEQQENMRRANRRTGLILLSIALAFFVGIVIKRQWMG